ncbi:MAG: NADH:flavin oxidoreductase/NADH oxidase family protein [Candidatus Pelagadaptatus aseana]|uniref:NADH:flavin oxidoreductase/NADH oxidase family protein n=1 Tax=Candidatus Pelagadaptatus aseana TaxID=3120508 RepID=UPI0039B1657E
MTTLSNTLSLPCGAEVKNRTFKSAMSEQLADRNNNPSTSLFNLYGAWAEGGIGICTSGNIMIQRDALGEPKNVVLDDSSDLEAFRQWTQAGRANGTQFWAQLNHPGKQIPSFLSKQPVAPSAIPLGEGLDKAFNCPRELSSEEISALIQRFADAAQQAKDVGFSGVQIHGAHGYLVSQFLSPHHNQRQDEWGGSLENRMRFVIEIYQAIRSKVGFDYPVAIKLNSADFQKGGFGEGESLEVIKTLESLGIDLIEISGGNYENPNMMGSGSTQKREAYFIDYAEKAKAILKNTPLVVTGGFRSAKAMNEAIQSGACDMVGMARPMAIDPQLPNKLISDSQHKITLKEPTTGIKVLDKFSMVGLIWYEHQMERIAKGKPAKPSQSSWYSVLRNFKDLGAHAWRKRRA